MINASPDGKTLVESEQWKEGTPEQRKVLLARERFTKMDHKYCKVCATVKSLLMILTFSDCWSTLPFAAVCLCCSCRISVRSAHVLSVADRYAICGILGSCGSIAGIATRSVSFLLLATSPSLKNTAPSSDTPFQ